MGFSLRKLLLVSALCVLAFPVLAAAPVTLRAVVEVDRPAIRLADVFDGLPEGLDRDIAIAPAAGKSVTYNQSVLTKLAEQYRLDWQPLSANERSVLTRASTQITAPMIEDAVKQKLKETLKNDRDAVDLVFDNRNLNVHLPSDHSPEFSLVNFAYDQPSHRFRAEIVAQTGGQPIQQPVSGRVTVKKSIPVLGKRLAAGTTIGDGDLKWITANEEQVGVDVIVEASQLVGQEMRHDHGDGEMLRSRDVIAPRLVLRGTMVTMKVETPVMQIITQGRALQDGAKGDVVRVNNVQSNRIVEGTVEASGVVRIGPLRNKIASAE